MCTLHFQFCWSECCKTALEVLDCPKKIEVTTKYMFLPRQILISDEAQLGAGSNF